MGALESVAGDSIDYRQLCENVSDLVYVCDDQGRILYVNPSFERLSGHSRESFVGLSFAPLFEDEDLERAVHNYQATLAGDSPEFELTFKDTGVLCQYKNIPLTDEAGRVVRVIGIARDVTRRRRAEEALRASEEKYRSFFENCPLGVAAYDRETTVTECSANFAEILGAERGRVIGLNLLRSLTDQRMLAALRKSLDGAVGVFEGDYQTIAGSKPVRIRLLFGPRFGPDGSFDGGVGIIEDIAERARLEQQAIQAQKLASLGTLAGGIAHDFNNLLTGILLSISMARLASGPDQLAGHLEAAEASGLRASELAGQLLTFSRGGEPRIATIRIEELLRRAATLGTRGTGVAVELGLAPDLWPAMADGGQLDQVFSNLVINAVQAAASRLSVVARNHVDEAGRAFLEVSVFDDGVGIPRGHQESIFDPYFTTKAGGSGLGLATCHSIVRRHGGEIGVESLPGEGTTFRVRLPASKEEAPAAELEEAAPESGQLDGRVLVMDDDQHVLSALGVTLEEFGLDVTLATEGGEAVARYEAAREAARPYDLVILDLTVVDGMGGVDAIAALRRIDPEVKAVVSSGYHNDPILSRAEEYGFRAVLSKPYRVNELLRLLERMLG